MTINDDTTMTAASDGGRAEARQVYRQSLDAEMPINGRQLGSMFGKSDRWGRERIAEVRAELGTESGTPETGTDTAADVPETGNGPAATTAPPPPHAADRAQTVQATAATPEPARAHEPVSDPVRDEGAAVVQPFGARAVVWAGFGLGTVASVAANIAHATPGVGPRLAAAFAPLALLLAIECMTRPVWNRTGRAWGLARYGGTGLVALVAAVMSYRHMHGLLIDYGEDPLSAAIGPLAVDGLMVVAGFALLATTPKRGARR